MAKVAFTFSPLNRCAIRIYIVVIFLTHSCWGMGQTKEQIDSIKNAVLKMIQNSPPIPDSVLQKSFKIRFPDPLIFSNVAEYKVKSFPGVFETAYFKEAGVKIENVSIKFYSVDIGKLNVTSGKIIACDPIQMKEAKPFIQQFPVGQFSVQLSIAKFNNDERIAFSRICFSDEPVVKWEFARDSGAPQIPIKGDKMYGYGVSAGLGLYNDENANVTFEKLSSKDENLWPEVFVEEIGKNYRNSWQYIFYNFNGHNLASFSTGFGDGRYGVYIGYDAQGTPCRLLTDFGLVPWWEK